MSDKQTLAVLRVFDMQGEDGAERHCAVEPVGIFDLAPGNYELVLRDSDAMNHAYAEGRKDEREEQEAFLRDLLWGEVQQCCGNYEAGDGGEYMGQREVVPVCCGCPDVERNDDAHILAVLRARIPEAA